RSPLDSESNTYSSQERRIRFLFCELFHFSGDAVIRPLRRATSGNGVQSWGFWNQDPGPRACKLDHYPQLKATGVVPAQWKFDALDWWLEEHGLIMEKPIFPLLAGKYLVTGDRKVTTVLTVHPKDKNGNQRWELADGATLYDVTYLGCRSARYTPAKAANACS